MKPVLACIAIYICIPCFANYVYCSAAHAAGTSVKENIEEHALLTSDLIALRQELRARMGRLDAQHQERGNTIKELQNELEKQKTQIDELEETIHRQQVEIKEIKDAINDKKRGISKYKEEAGTADGDTASKEARVGQYPRIRRQVDDGPVAFFAKLSQDQTHLGNEQNIVFDQVETNIGQGYNPRIGAFVAPVSGIYVFSAEITTRNADTSYYGFFVNGRHTTVMFVNGRQSSWDSASQTIVVSLSKGDDVTVKHTDMDKSVEGSNHSIFSGFLLPQMGPSSGQPVLVGGLG